MKNKNKQGLHYSTLTVLILSNIVSFGLAIFFTQVPLSGGLVYFEEMRVRFATVSIAHAATAWPGTGRTEIANPAGSEPSGIIWHPRYGKWFFVHDNGSPVTSLYMMNYDGSSVKRLGVDTGADSDLEDIAYADPTSNKIYLLYEGNQSAGTGQIWEVNADTAISASDGDTLPVNRKFSISDVPISNGNGPEGLTFIPDSLNSEGGVFAVGTQQNGKVYFYSLPIVSSSVGTTATHLTGSPWNSPISAACSGCIDLAGLEYDRIKHQMWWLYDGEDRLVITSDTGTVATEYTVPSDQYEGIGIGIGNQIAMADDAGGVDRYDFLPLDRYANLTQSHYRWRNDNANEATASFGATEDTATSSIALNEVKRLRLEVSNEGTASSSQKFMLQFSTASTTGWLTVPDSSSCASSAICMVASQLSEGSATTNVASGLTDENTTFVAGEQKETTATSTITSLDIDKFTELEYSIKPTSNAAYATDYFFRLVTTTGIGDATALDTYTATVKMTTVVAPDSTAPTITNVSSDKVDGTYKAADVIDIDVTFSEAVSSTGNVTVTLETGTTDRTCTFTVSNSTTGTCDYTVQAGDASSDLTVNTISGTIADQSSNPMTNFVPATNLAANKALVIDTTIITPPPPPPPPPPSSGGGGGGGHSSNCTSNWSCGAWSVCSNSVQTRLCTDLNSCSQASQPPATSQSCGQSTTTSTSTPSSSSGDSPSDSTIAQRIKDVISREKSRLKTLNTSLRNRLSGWILLQTQEKGEAWYLEPLTKLRYYLANGSEAYTMLSRFGLGITDTDLKSIPVGLSTCFQGTDTDSDKIPDKMEEGIGTDIAKADSDNDTFSDGDEILGGYNPLGAGKLSTNSSLINKLKGRILLQVQAKGQAWYLNPKDGKRYYTQNGEAAYQIMRCLSLGVGNSDLNTLSVGE